MTDHKAEAERLLSKAFSEFQSGAQRYGSKEQAPLIAASDVHATLYLAEQQRVVALMTAIEKWGTDDKSWPLAIREGLGI